MSKLQNFMTMESHSLQEPQCQLQSILLNLMSSFLYVHIFFLKLLPMYVPRQEAISLLFFTRADWFEEIERLSIDLQLGQEIERIFEEHTVSVDDYAKNPSLVGDNKLVVRIRGKFYPATVAMGVLLAYSAFGYEAGISAEKNAKEILSGTVITTSRSKPEPNLDNLIYLCFLNRR